jgi:DNA repair exonuclease SbcCD ATPase subunit
MSNLFKQWWIGKESFNKSEKLTRKEMELARSIIEEDRAKSVMSSKTIEKLQSALPKLNEEWKAARVYWTETKREDTEIVAEAGEDLGLDKYRVILSPNACPVCEKKTDNGRKVFKQEEIDKAGYGHAPPFHPNCYCFALPVV